MTYFFVEAYNNYGDYSFFVFAESKDKIEQALKEHRDEETLSVSICGVHGPYSVNDGQVLAGKNPE